MEVCLFQGSDSQILDAINSRYTESLLNDLYKVETHLEAAKADVTVAMRSLRELLLSFKKTSMLDEDFIT